MRSVLILAVLLCPGLAEAASPIATFDVPGATSTCAMAISGTGIVTGLAADSAKNTTRPFLYDAVAGHFAFPRPATAPGVVLFLGTTRNRTILVSDILSQTVGDGEYFYRAGKTTALSGVAASAKFINDSGTLIGQTAVFPTGLLGFVLRPSGKTTMLNDGSGFVQPAAIDTANRRVVGISGNGAFYYDGKTYHILAAPGATVGTYPRGVDTLGRVSGSFYTGTQTQPVPNGFLLRKGVYTTWNVPGATSTEINGANEAGEIAGCYNDGTKTHGFVAIP